MPVLVEALSVVVRRSRIAETYPGGWAAFVRAVPNRTLCMDGDLARVGFMAPADVGAFIEHLEARGLVFMKAGAAQDIVVMDQLHGPTCRCDWIETAQVPMPGGGEISAARLAGSQATGVDAPEGWTYEGSLSARFTYVASGSVPTELELVRREGGTEVYRDRRSGKEVYMGRTTGNAPASASTRLVIQLVERGQLRSAIDPSTLPAPRTQVTSWSKVEGMLLGLAIGDSLGNRCESMVPRDRRAALGEIRDYLPNHHAEGRRVGLPSDDTQLAFRTLQHLLDDGALDAQRLARRLESGQIFGLGSTVRAFLRARAGGADWLHAKQESAGNGALMRIAPILLPHLQAPTSALWSDALLAGAVTHDDFASNASCVAFVAVLWEALAATPPVPRGFWLDRFCEVAARIEGSEPRYEPRAPHRAGSETTLVGFLEAELPPALEAGRSVVEACDDWYSGAFLLETVPAVLYVLERHGNDPEEAIVRAVNDTRDNDTVAAIVGAAVGALHGVDALPRRWREGLLGRLGSGDDGAIDRLLSKARPKFWGS